MADILSLAKLLGAKNIYDNPFATSPVGLNYAQQEQNSDSAERMLNEASTPVGAIGAGINFYLQSKQKKKALDALGEELKTQAQAQEQKRSTLASLFPNDQKAFAETLDLSALQELAQRRLLPQDPDAALDRDYKKAQINKLNRENSIPINPQTGQPIRPIPPNSLKLQNEGLDIIGTAKGINADLAGVVSQIDKNQLKLGPVKNMVSQFKNYVGNSSPSSRNFASLKATLEKQRNDSLRLNKGVQTEGDATRAWNELFANINDPNLVKQRLMEIQAINDRAADLQKLNIDQIRANFGAEPIDFSNYDNRPTAIGAGGNKSGFKIISIRDK